MGASRNMYVQLGNQTLYWRAYSQYIGSLPSAPVSFGAPPIAVAGGGATGPAPLPSSGSGVFPNGVARGGNGFGIHPGSRIVRQTVLYGLSSTGRASARHAFGLRRLAPPFLPATLPIFRPASPLLLRVRPPQSISH